MLVPNQLLASCLLSLAPKPKWHQCFHCQVSQNLSSRPRERHQEICRHHKEQLQQLVPLYYEILNQTSFPRVLGFLAKCVLRRVYSQEENEEINGIVEATGLGRHLVVAYCTFLDIFSGCISGGVKVNDAGLQGKDSSMVHFRNLDWEMEPLRKLTITVEYHRDGEVARGITYAGYIGTLTGVRKGLSISLNYRSAMNSSSATFSHRVHQVLLLLGFRPSNTSRLRTILLAPGPVPTLAQLAASVPSMTTSPCYLTFCSPSSVLLIEKDLKSAVVDLSTEFLAVTNHDKEMKS